MWSDPDQTSQRAFWILESQNRDVLSPGWYVHNVKPGTVLVILPPGGVGWSWHYGEHSEEKKLDPSLMTCNTVLYSLHESIKPLLLKLVWLGLSVVCNWEHPNCLSLLSTKHGSSKPLLSWSLPPMWGSEEAYKNKDKFIYWYLLWRKKKTKW